MKLKKLKKRQKQFIHKKTKKIMNLRKIFVHGFIAAAAVAILAVFFTSSLSSGGLILFASVAASAAIMCHYPKSKSNSIRTIILSYFIAVIISIFIWQASNKFDVSLALMSFIAVFVTVVMFFIFDVFHPPAISAVMGFLLYDQIMVHLAMLMVSIFVMLAILKLLWYVYSEELEVEHFVKEFTKEHYGRK